MSFKEIIQSKYLRRIIFQKVSEIHRRLGHKSVISYGELEKRLSMDLMIKFGRHDMFIKHFDSISNLMSYKTEYNASWTLLPMAIKKKDWVITRYIIKSIKKCKAIEGVSKEVSDMPRQCFMYIAEVDQLDIIMDMISVSPKKMDSHYKNHLTRCLQTALSQCNLPIIKAILKCLPNPEALSWVHNFKFEIDGLAKGQETRETISILLDVIGYHRISLDIILVTVSSACDIELFEFTIQQIGLKFNYQMTAPIGLICGVTANKDVTKVFNFMKYVVRNHGDIEYECMLGCLHVACFNMVALADINLLKFIQIHFPSRIQFTIHSLFKALEEGYEEIARYLLDNNLIDTFFITAMHPTFINVPFLTYLYSQPSIHSNSSTLLATAIETSNFEVIDYLLDPNQSNIKHDMAAALASSLYYQPNNIHLAESILSPYLSTPAVLNALTLNTLGNSLVKDDDFDLVNRLIDIVPDNIQYSISSMKALIRTSKFNIIELLHTRNRLHKTKNLIEDTNSKENILYKAIEFRSFSTLQLLVNHYMAPDTKSNDDFFSISCLNLAIRIGDLEMTKFVFERTRVYHRTFDLLADLHLWECSLKGIFKWETPTYKYLYDQLLFLPNNKFDQFQLATPDLRRQEYDYLATTALENEDIDTILKLEKEVGVDNILLLIGQAAMKSSNIHIIKYYFDRVHLVLPAQKPQQNCVLM